MGLGSQVLRGNTGCTAVTRYSFTGRMDLVFQHNLVGRIIGIKVANHMTRRCPGTRTCLVNRDINEGVHVKVIRQTQRVVSHTRKDA